MNENSAGAIARAMAEMVTKETSKEPPVNAKTAAGGALTLGPVKQMEKELAKKAGKALKNAGVKAAEQIGKGSTVRFVKKKPAKAVKGADGKDMPNEPGENAAEAAAGAVKRARDMAADVPARAAEAMAPAVMPVAKAGAKAAETAISAAAMGAGAPVAKAASAAAGKGADAAHKAETASRHAAADEMKMAGNSKEGAGDTRTVGADALSSIIRGGAASRAAAVATGKDIGKELAKGMTGR